MTNLERAILSAVERLAGAAASGRSVAPVRDLLGSTDVDVAYQVQRALARRREATGATVVGRKIGLTSPAVQKQLGVDQPDFGILFDDMAFGSGETIPTARLIQPKVEAEVAFVLSEDLDGPLSLGRVAAAVDHAVAALEIVDSRVSDWDITIVDTVADNGSSGLFVLAPRQVPLEEFTPREAKMTMTIDGVEVSRGTGAACMGDPLLALLWLAQAAERYGEPLRAGEIVLSGALGPMAPAAAGNAVRAEIAGLGEVSANFSQEPT